MFVQSFYKASQCAFKSVKCEHVDKLFSNLSCLKLHRFGGGAQFVQDLVQFSLLVFLLLRSIKNVSVSKLASTFSCLNLASFSLSSIKPAP